MSEGIITFDLDSTVADTEHRFGLINRAGGTDWHAYSQACVDDEPVRGIVTLIRTLVAAGVECHALSGRKASALLHTQEWFAKHEIPIEHFWLDESESGDYAHWRQHVEYKLDRLRDIERETGKKVILHVDDWAGVAAGFEEAGVPCICVRTPFEIREIVSRDSAKDGDAIK